MKRGILAFLLCLGVVLGLCSGFHSLHYHHHGRDHFERHIADLCVDAAERRLEHRRE